MLHAGETETFKKCVEIWLEVSLEIQKKKKKSPEQQKMLSNNIMSF